MNDAYAVQTTHFQGPLDLLLSLIEERKLYINDLSLAEVTDGYLSYVQQLETLPLAETSQFILIASTLLLIKSRSLLPNMEISDEEKGDIEELKRRLAWYQEIKQATKILGETWHGTHLRFPAKQPVSPVISFRPGEATIDALQAAIKHIVSSLPVQTFRAEAVVEATLSLEEVIGTVRERVFKAVKTKFSELSQGRARHEIILHFLALLELVKGGALSAEQEKAFSDIMLESQQVSTPSYGV